ncbi:hypothetical protein B9Q03_02715 [Candidatus Marsarchaeota G2 archaeon OSP_D]|jgi:alpha-NAC-related protein|uniref:Nascent polypeptide-associated complex protein n=3 Tax=Candidatus Marsarchaeota group 2 TaxID=2203771 RepID=A0A2R6BBY9_9ARCH|nr:MAG: hypothetical protein B9Q03_02715 [Candidatus Marsarchaeota G2 archaeon OSP_D]PSN92946.1 MAG: hypothetical protein B9Q08_00170 [Candidatus Marsarchaeota G2 archaeon ECH_B_SAG-M15]PSN96174.1 MAG: hypothetical protein B9Q09_02460 [Candidatus Marsarchaeota G2 archaeon ECH_B_SAG-C16]
MKLNNSDMRRLMRQMGLGAQEVIDTEEVIIRTHDKVITIISPQVVKLTIQGQTLYQVIGGTEKSSEQQPTAKKEESFAVSDEDVSFVATQANVPLEVARSALAETKGDIAKAIMKLRST